MRRQRCIAEVAIHPSRRSRDKGVVASRGPSVRTLSATRLTAPVGARKIIIISDLAREGTTEESMTIDAPDIWRAASSRWKAVRTMAHWPKAVVFDLDGTLVDSAPDLAAAINEVLQHDGLEPFGLAEVTGFVGHGVRRLVERAYAARAQPLSDADLTAKVAVFQSIYRDGIAVRTRLFDGAMAFVEALSERGIKIGLCTNKAEALTWALLDGLRIGGIFDAVVGGRSDIVAKPAADMLLETLRRLGCAPADAVMVGDSHSDVACARAAHVRVVGVTFGYTDVPMRDLRPDVMIDHFNEGLAALQSMADTR